MAENNPAPSEDTATFAGLSHVAQIVGQFVAPATLLAGLLFYWGFFHARGFCGYFGVNSAVLGLSSTDYVMRSADGLFIPLAAVGVTALVLLWSWTVLPEQVRRAPKPTWLLVTLAVLALALVSVGLSRLVWKTTFNAALGLAPACLITGILLFLAVVRMRQAGSQQAGAGSRPDHSWRPLEWGLVLLLVGGAFFWGATDYSMAVGRGRAITYVDTTLPSSRVVVFSERNLGLSVPGVTVTRCADPQAAYRYRYDGLALVMSTEHALLLLPRDWLPGEGTAIVLPREGPGATRFEYLGRDAQRPLEC